MGWDLLGFFLKSKTINLQKVHVAALRSVNRDTDQGETKCDAMTG